MTLFNIIKYIAKKFSGIVLGNYYVFSLAKTINRNKLLILYYHRIIDNSSQEIFEPDLAVSSSGFDKQMQLLKKKYNCVDEDEIINAIKKKSIFPKNPVWITFDDGYEDNFRVAFPILKKYDLPATIFLTTGYINNTHSYKEYIFLNWDQIKEMKNSKISFGAHTISHPILSTLSTDIMHEEIKDSKIEIERRLGATVNTFAYPKGKKKYYKINNCKPILKQINIQLAVSTIGGFNKLTDFKSPLNLRRIGISYEDTLGIFKSKLGFGAFWQL